MKPEVPPFLRSRHGAPLYELRSFNKRYYIESRWKYKAYLLDLIRKSCLLRFSRIGVSTSATLFEKIRRGALFVVSSREHTFAELTADL